MFFLKELKVQSTSLLRGPLWQRTWADILKDQRDATKVRDQIQLGPVRPSVIRGRRGTPLLSELPASLTKPDF